MWRAKTAIDEEVWTAEYVKLVLSSHARRPLPVPMQRIGQTMVVWQEPIPGRYHVHATGGTVDDRVLARAIVAGQLDAYGLRPVPFTFGGPELRKTADWNEVQEKAIRLINDGSVQVLRNAPDAVVGHVIGDHGEYQTEISRQDPNSMVIDHWTCECPWDQFAWQRTRRWKSLEGRPCAHVLATHWYAQKLPLDTEYDPTTGQPIPPENQHGQLGLPLTAPTGPPPPGGMAPPGMPGASPPAPSQQLSIPGIDPGTATMTPPMPPGSNIIPPFPGAALPPPVSVPGAKLPDATNPLQWPGGTFSKVATDWDFSDKPEAGATPQEMNPDFAYGRMNDNDIEWYDDMGHEENTKVCNALGIEVPDGDDDDDWRFAATGDTFQNSDMVRINKEEYGIAEGKSTEHGSGEYRTIAKNSIGEVLGQDPTTKWVDCIFPIHDAGPMEPYHIRAWIDPSNLTPMPGIKKPGPFLRRKR
jgi:hypothetical protein